MAPPWCYDADTRMPLSSLTQALVRLGSRYGMDFVYLATGGFWITARHIVISLLLLISGVAFANLLPPETYGTYQYVLAAAALLAIPALGGLNQSISQAVAAGKEETVYPAQRMKFLFGLIGSGAALIGTTYYYFQGNMVLASCFALVAVFMPFAESYLLYVALPSGRKDFRRGGIYQAALQALVTCGSLAALLITDNVIILVALYMGLSTLGRMVAWKLVTGGKNPPTGGTDEAMLSFGKHMSIMNALATAAQYADRVLLFQLIGGAQVALYTVSLAIPEQIKGLFKNTFELLLPRYASYDPNTIKRSIWKKFWLMSLGLLVVSALYIAIAPFLIGFLFPLYPEAVLYSQLFVLSELTIATGVFTTALQALHKTKELYAVHVASALSQLLCAAVGIFFFGVIGAIVARMASRLFSSVLTIVLYERS
jgi:O-antigen/teichoic acid export membrane protein